MFPLHDLRMTGSTPKSFSAPHLGQMWSVIKQDIPKNRSAGQKPPVVASCP